MNIHELSLATMQTEILILLTLHAPCSLFLILFYFLVLILASFPPLPCVNSA